MVVNKREIAIKWWNNLIYSEQFYVLYINRDSIAGGISRHLDTLTGSEIELLYNKSNKRLKKRWPPFRTKQ